LDVTDPRCAYLIVGNPRTGSTVLARALTKTGCMGRPDEYFWRGQEKEWASRFGLPAPDEANYAEYIRAALQYGTTSNGVFAAKVFWAHAEDLIRRTADIPHLMGLPGHQRFRRVFADELRAVFLRRNCLRAAVSLWRAEVSGVWNLSPGEKAPPPPPALDLWRVTLLHALMHAGEIGWPQLLNSINVDYVTLHYDDVAIRLSQSVQCVAEFVGVELPDADVPAVPVLSRQADTATEQFVAEWQHETGGCPACEDGTEL
jgi:trehalose 2-sulfotransferase